MPTSRKRSAAVACAPRKVSSATMLPLSDSIPGRRFPFVNVALIAANFALYPNAKVLTLVVFFPVRISAWFFLGFWFVYQIIEVNGLNSATADGGGVAFFAHIGGFVFGLLVAFALSRTGRIDADP